MKTQRWRGAVTRLAEEEDSAARWWLGAGDTYLVVGAENVADPKVLAVILDAVPGVDSESRQLEPGEVIGIEPGPGELVWSTILPPASAARLLEAFPE